MEHTKILKKSWGMLRGYRMLWVFGFIFALTTVSGQESILFNSPNRDNQIPALRFDRYQGWEWNWPENYWPGLNEFERIFPDVLQAVITIVISVAIFIGLLILITTIFRYVSETALIRMVDIAESSGEHVGFRTGVRLGWSGAAARLFFVDLLINLPFALAVLVLLGVSAIPVLAFSNRGETTLIFGGILTTGLFFLVIFFAIVGWAALSLIRHLAKRVSVLEGSGPWVSIQQGFLLARQHIRDVGLMWLILIGINLGWQLLVIPVVFLGLVLGTVVGGSVGLVAGGVTGFAFENPVQWIVGVLAGLPFFILIVAAPAAFVEGLKETYLSSTWTMTYREIRGLDTVREGDFTPEPPTDETGPVMGDSEVLPETG